MRGLLLAGIMMPALGHRPSAADHSLPVKTPPKKSYDWSGFYAGAHFGYAAGSSQWTAHATGAGAPPLSGSIDAFNSFNVFKGTGSYFDGFQGGYNYLLPSRQLFGVEADVSFPNTGGGMATFAAPATGTANYGDQGE